MMKPYRVISIDWDYLIGASAEERCRLFPDGGNECIPSMLQDIIWIGRYAEQELQDIKVDTQALEVIKSFLKKSCSNLNLCIVYDSHKYLFDEVVNNILPNQPLELINIDFHHDCYTYTDYEINCGNWANHLFKDTSFRSSCKEDKYYWVGRADSDPIDTPMSNVHMLSASDLLTLENFDCDLLFICRSSMWSPPHLDEDFIELYQWVDKNIVPVEVNITGSRYTEEFKQQVEQNRNMITNLLHPQE